MDYRVTVHVCRVKTWKTKTQLNFKPNIKNSFKKYVNSNSKSKENIGLVIVEDSWLTGMRKSRGIQCLFLLFQVSVILIDIGQPDPLSQRSMCVGTLVFLLWIVKFSGNNCINWISTGPWGLMAFSPEHWKR